MPRIAFYVLPKGAAADDGKRLGEMVFKTDRDRDAFVRGVSVLTDGSLAPMFKGGSTLSSRECGVLVAKVRKAINSGGESTLSSVLTEEVVDLERGALEGKLEQFCEMLETAAKGTGLLTSVPE
jgi:hypothetical protein